MPLTSGPAPEPSYPKRRKLNEKKSVKNSNTKRDKDDENEKKSSKKARANK